MRAEIVGALVGVLLAALVAFARAHGDEPAGPARGAHPSVEHYAGVGADGGPLWLDRSGAWMRWRVDSPGTRNCTPSGRRLGPNFAWSDSGPAGIVRPDGRFVSEGGFTHRTAIDGVAYRKLVRFGFEGRVRGRTAQGTFWRRDRLYRRGALAFECMRSTAWRAPRRR